LREIKNGENMVSTAQLNRVFAAVPEKVFRAFKDLDAIPAEMCYLRWQQSLILLDQLAGLDIPD
jgi:uncharacterized protein YndB with AHSA1/START domain